MEKQQVALMGSVPDYWYVEAMEKLVGAVQELSHARDLETVVAIVREAARDLTGADGATFVLRDDDKCYYMDENALEPLWKGSRFPMSMCVSGWVMRHALPLIINDIYKDPRIPIDVYRKTFVKSMAMVPIRTDQPIGAIGNYWAEYHEPTEKEMSILKALANVTSVALENIDLYAQLEEKIKALKKSNEELSRFAWAASHDLKSPLRAIDNLAHWIEEEVEGTLSEKGQKYVETLHRRVGRLDRLIDDILGYARTDWDMAQGHHDMASGQDIMKDIIDMIHIGEGLKLEASADFLKVNIERKPITRILYNLIDNAIKHHDTQVGNISVSVSTSTTLGKYVFSVTDDVDTECFRRALKKSKAPNPFFRACDGVEALDFLQGKNGKAKIDPPRIIFLDINMPRMNGFEFLEKIKRDGCLGENIVFMLTTSGRESDIEMASSYHVSGYLIKGDVQKLAGFLENLFTAEMSHATPIILS